MKTRIYAALSVKGLTLFIFIQWRHLKVDCVFEFSKINKYLAFELINFHSNLTSIDVRFWRLKSVPALKGVKSYTSHNII